MPTYSPYPFGLVPIVSSNRNPNSTFSTSKSATLVFTDSSRVFYKTHTTSTGVGSVRNARVIAKKT